MASCVFLRVCTWASVSQREWIRIINQIPVISDKFVFIHRTAIERVTWLTRVSLCFRCGSWTRRARIRLRIECVTHTQTNIQSTYHFTVEWLWILYILTHFYIFVLACHVHESVPIFLARGEYEGDAVVEHSFRQPRIEKRSEQQRQ